MKKTSIVIIAVLALCGPGRARALDLDDARSVRRLQEKAGADQLLSLASSRPEIALALADVAAQAASPQGSDSQFNAQDYDALFALMQQYREELVALGLRQTSVDAAMKALDKRIADLEQRMEYLPPDGMKVHGRFHVMGDDLQITGPGQFQGNPTRFRHFKQWVELEFTAVHGPFLGLTQFDIVNLVGSYASPAPYGVRRVYAEVRTPISMQMGDFTTKLSPLTVWRNEDPDEFEPEPFRSRRQRLRDHYFLTGNNHEILVRALRISTDLVFGESEKALELEILGSTLGGSGTGVYEQAVPTTGLSGSSLALRFITYFADWRAEMELFKGLRLGYLGAKIWDETETGFDTYGAGDLAPDFAWMVGMPVRATDNEVHSARLQLSLFGGALEGEAELARSSYINPNVGVTVPGLTGTAAVPANVPNYFADPTFRAGGAFQASAMHASLSAGKGWGRLTLRMRQVDEGYVAPAAQTRTHDRNRTPNGPFLTENILFNPSTNAFTGLISPNYVESTFFARFVPPSLAGSSGFVFNYMVPYDIGYESSSPYGLATPNRTGYGAELRFNIYKGLFQPMVMADLAQQLEKQMGRAQEVYTQYGGGLVMDLKGALGWPVKMTAGYRLEDTRNGEWIAFDSTKLDLGLEYYPVESTGLFAGFRHIDYNGTIYNSASIYAPLGQFGVHQLYETLGLGLRHRMGDRITIDLVYSHLDFPNRNAALTFGQEVAYKMDQSFLKFSVAF